MKQFSVPVLPIRVERDTDSKMQSYEVSGIELEYIPDCTAGRNLFTGAFFAGGTDGLAVSFCAEAPHAKPFAQRNYDSYTQEGINAQQNNIPAGFAAQKRAYKGRVFEDDCLELFIQPADSYIYYGWEINAGGACLDYRAGIGDEGLKRISTTTTSFDRTLISNPAIHGRQSDLIADTVIHFDYDWQSRAQWRLQCEDEFWYMELFVPWSDFGMAEPPKEGTTWFATINRIDAGAAKIAHIQSLQGLQSLLDFDDDKTPPLPRFHQPARFAAFKWTHVPKKNTDDTY